MLWFGLGGSRSVVLHDYQLWGSNLRFDGVYSVEVLGVDLQDVLYAVGAGFPPCREFSCGGTDRAVGNARWQSEVYLPRQRLKKLLPVCEQVRGALIEADLGSAVIKHDIRTSAITVLTKSSHAETG